MATETLKLPHLVSKLLEKSVIASIDKDLHCFGCGVANEIETENIYKLKTMVCFAMTLCKESWAVIFMSEPHPIQVVTLSLPAHLSDTFLGVPHGTLSLPVPSVILSWNGHQVRPSHGIPHEPWILSHNMISNSCCCLRTGSKVSCLTTLFHVISQLILRLNILVFHDSRRNIRTDEVIADDSMLDAAL